MRLGIHRLACSGGHTRKLVYKEAAISLAAIGGAGGNDEEKMPKRRGRSPTPEGAKSGGVTPARVCRAGCEKERLVRGGGAPAWARIESSSVVSKTDVASIQTFALAGSMMGRFRPGR